MSKDEQDQILGRTIREYQEVTRQLGALAARISAFGDVLSEIGDDLQSTDTTALGRGLRPARLSEMPNREEIDKAVGEFVPLQERQQALEKILRGMGVDPPFPR